MACCQVTEAQEALRLGSCPLERTHMPRAQASRGTFTVPTLKPSWTRPGLQEAEPWGRWVWPWVPFWAQCLWAQRWEREVRREQRRWTQEGNWGDRSEETETGGKGAGRGYLEEGNGKEGGVEGGAGGPESGGRSLWVGVGINEGENQEGTWGGEAFL